MDTTTPTQYAGEHPLALSPNQAAALLGVSRDTFDEHILPQLGHRVVGRRRLIPYIELQAFINDSAVLAKRGGLSRV